MGGREALEKQRAEGLARKLVCLTLDEEKPETPLHGNETIWRDGQCIGYVKSTAFGFTSGKMGAYGYVDAPEGKPLKPKAFNEWLSAGKWHISDRHVQRPSTLCLKSVFDPSNKRIKGEYPPDVYAAPSRLLFRAAVTAMPTTMIDTWCCVIGHMLITSTFVRARFLRWLSEGHAGAGPHVNYFLPASTCLRTSDLRVWTRQRWRHWEVPAFHY